MQNQKGNITLIIVGIIALLAIGGGMYWYSQKSSGDVCIQVITPAKNLLTGKCKEFSTPCNVPMGWKEVDDCSMSKEK